MYKQGILASKKIAASVALLFLMFIAYAWFVAMPLRDLFIFGSTLLCAATPFGVPLVGSLQSALYKQGSRVAWGVKQTLTTYLTASVAQSAIIITSAILFMHHDIPLAFSAVQVLAITSIVLLPALVVSPLDTPLGKHPSSLLDANTIRTALWHGLLIAALSVVTYIWFFKQHYLPISYVMPGSPDHQQAMSVVFITLSCCLLMSALQHRSASHGSGLFGRRQLTNRSTLFALGVSIFCILNALYNPWVAPYFGMVPLGWPDLGSAAAATLTYIAITEFHQHNKKHSRKAVLALHHQTKSKSSLNTPLDL